MQQEYEASNNSNRNSNRVFSLLKPCKWLLAASPLGKLPVAYKLGLVMSALTVLTLSTLLLIVSRHLTQTLNQQMDMFGHTIAIQTAHSAAELVLAEDLLSLSVSLTQAVQAPDILHARIRDMNNQVLAESNNNNNIYPVDAPLPETIGVYTAPIHFQDVTAGFADILIDKAGIAHTIQKSIHWMTAATLLLFVAGIGFAMILGRNITGPIARLTHATRAIAQGNLDFRIQEKRYDELGILIDSFNKMAGGLKERQQIKATFNRYVDPSVADQLLGDLENPSLPMGYVQGSVLFIDIVNFTGLCETAKPDQVATLLNLYYEYVHKASSSFGGMVDKFIGDGAMVLFGAPRQDPEHCFNAICSAFLFLEVAKHFNRVAGLNKLPRLQFRLGLHSGEMIAGSLGGQDRLQYTAVGDTVNIASRLCHNGKINALTLSRSAFEQACGESRLVAVNDAGLWSVKGKQHQINVCIAKSLLPPYDHVVRKRAHLLRETLSLASQENMLRAVS